MCKLSLCNNLIWLTLMFRKVFLRHSHQHPKLTEENLTNNCHNLKYLQFTYCWFILRKSNTIEKGDTFLRCLHIKFDTNCFYLSSLIRLILFYNLWMKKNNNKNVMSFLLMLCHICCLQSQNNLRGESEKGPGAS